MSDAVIYDRGYRHYEGERRGRAGARWAVMRDGLRRVLGLRRKARRKVFPWSLIAVTVAAAAVLLALHFAAGSVAAALAEGLPRYPELFDFYSRIGVLFVAVAVPELLIPDRTEGVLSVYFSRPLTVTDYLVGKLGAYLGLVGAIYLVPQLILHLGLASLSEEGFLPYLVDTAEVAWQVPVVAAAYLAAYGALAVALAAWIPRTGFAAAGFLGVLLAGGGLAELVARSELPGARYLSLLAIDSLPRMVRDWVFDTDSGRFPPEVAGMGPGAAATTIALLTLAAGVVVVRRYRRLA